MHVGSFLGQFTFLPRFSPPASCLCSRTGGVGAAAGCLPEGRAARGSGWGRAGPGRGRVQRVLCCQAPGSGKLSANHVRFRGTTALAPLGSPKVMLC